MSVSGINFCINCGNSVKGNKYCSKCGKKVESTVLASNENNVSLKGNNQVKETESCEFDKSNGKELLKSHTDEETKNAEFFANELHNPKLYRNFSERIRTLYKNNQIDNVEADYLIIKYSQLKNNLKSKVNKGDISLMQALNMMNLTFDIVKQKSIVSSSKSNPKSGMIHKHWKPNEPINAVDYLTFLCASLFAFVIPPLGMTLVTVLTYRRLRTIGIINKFLAFILSLLIIPILFLWFGFIFFGAMDADIFIYIFLFLSLIAFAYLIFKNPKP